MYFYYNTHSEKSPITDLTVSNCGFENCDPSHSFGPAIRDYYLLHFVQTGNGRFTTNHGTFTIGEGGLFLINPGELTYYKAHETDPWNYSWVGFDGIKAKLILSNLGFCDSNPILYTSEISAVGSLFDQMNRLVTESFSPELGCLGFLYQILQYFVKENPIDNNSKKHNGRVLLEKTIHYFEENFPYDITIKQVADHIGLDRTALFRIFKSECGLSPKEYLIRFRIKKASELLQKTSLSIAEISSSVGMDNTAHFSTIFKNRLDISPREYRKNPFELSMD